MSADRTTDVWDDEEFRLRARPRARTTPLVRIGLGAALAAACLAAVALVVWGAIALLADRGAPKRLVVSVNLVPLPPPPLPPPEPKPPEPEMEEPPLPEPAPPEAIEEPPVGELLGLDTDQTGDGGLFDLVPNRGGRSITDGDAPSGDPRARFAWFTGQVQSHLKMNLRRRPELRETDYQVVLRVWFGRDGRVERYELAGSSGNPEIDRNLRLSLDALPPLSQPPPADMPQPVTLRISNRGSG